MIPNRFIAIILSLNCHQVNTITRLKHLIPLILALSICDVVFSQSMVVQVDVPSQPLELAGFLPLLKDSTSYYEVGHFADGRLDSLFNEQAYDLTTETYWGLIRFHFQHEGLYYLSTINCFNRLEGFLFIGDSLVADIHTGYDFPLKKRSWQRAAATAHIPIQIPEKGHYRLLLKFTTYTSPLLQWRNLEQPQLYTDYQFDSYIFGGHLVGGVYIGITLLAFLLNLIWYSSTRNVIYLYFTLFVASGFIYKTATSGYLTEWLYPSFPIIAAYLRNIFPTLVYLFYALFCLEFIDARKNFRKADQVLKVMLRIYCILLPFFFFTAPIYIAIVLRGIFDNIIVIFLAVLVLSTFSKKYNYPKRQLTFFSMGVFVFFIGSLVFVVHYLFDIFQGNMFFKFYFSTVTSLRETFLLIGTAYGFLHNEKLLAIESKTNTKIKQQKVQLEKLYATNKKILSLVTHDIKNPLFSLQVTAEMLKNKEINEKEFEHIVEDLGQSMSHTSVMLENVLIWAKNQDTSLNAIMEPHNGTEIMLEAIELVKPIATTKSITLDINTPAEVWVICDREMASSILRNLLTNAIKFSGSGSRIEVSIAAGRHRATFLVRDFGIGMSSEQVDNIYALSQETRRGTANEKGTGLGLMLSQDFAKKMSSHLDIESQEKKGSSFSFSLELFT